MRPIHLSAILVALAVVLTACTGGATQAPTTGATSPPAATDTPTEAPEPTEPAEPTGTPATEPTGTPATEPTGTPATEPTATTGPGVTEAPSPTPLAPVSEEGTLTLWVDETRAPLMTSLGQQFTDATGVPVAVQQLGFGDIRDQLKIYGPNQVGPDIIIGAHDWLGELATPGYLAPIDLEDLAASFDPTAVEAFTYDGVLYGMPYATEAIALYYNTDHVAEPPATWPDLQQTALDLQADGTVQQGYVLQTNPGDPYHSYPLLTANGGYIFGETDAGYDPTDVGLDSEGGIAYANMLDQMIDDGVLVNNVDYNTMISLFTEGDSAMFMTGPWALPDIRASGIPFDIAQIPSAGQDGRPFVGVQGFMISAYAANPALAQTFLKDFVATDLAMTEIYTTGSRPPAWTGVTVDDPQLVAFTESGADGDPLPAIPEMSSVWESWTDALELIFAGSDDPEQTIRDAAAAIRDKISGE